MKKPYKVLSATALAAVLATSSLVPVIAQAAPANQIKDVIVSKDGVNYKMKQSQYDSLVDAGKVPGTVAFITSSTGKTYTINQFNNAIDSSANVDEALTKLDTTATAQNPTTVDATFDSNGNLVTTPVAGDLKVESVMATNAKTLEIKFNTALDSASAEDEANYTVSGSVAVSEAKLSADKKSVTLTLGSLLTNDTQYTVTVDKDLKVASGTAFAKTDYVTNILFNDEVKPVVSAVSTPNGDLRVTLNEVLTAPSDAKAIVVVVNGQSITLGTGQAAWVSKNVITVPKASLPASLENGKSYSIAVAGANDLVGNAMELYSSNFTYLTVTDTTAPTLVSTKVTGETSVELTFSEELTATNAADLGLVVKKNGATLSGATVSTDDKVTYEVDLSGVVGAYAANETSSAIELTAVGFKDLGNNIAGSVTKTVTLVKDTVKPTLSKTVYNATDDKVILTFSEEIVSGGNLTTDIKIVNNATSQVVTTPITTAISADKKSIVIPAATLTDGSYTIYLNAGTVEDTALAPNDNAALNTTVSVSNELAKPTVASVTASGDVITVEYTPAVPVKGGQGATSAANLANYKLDGKALPVGTLVTLDAASDTATITLPTGSIESTRTGILTVSNVEGTNGAKLDSSNSLVALVDTKAPVLLSAKVVSNELVLTFSENVDAATADVDFVASDFNVKINGVDVTEVLAAGTNKNQLKITASDASFATGTITVEVDDTATGTDGDNNVIVRGTVVTATR